MKQQHIPAPPPDPIPDPTLPVPEDPKDPIAEEITSLLGSDIGPEDEDPFDDPDAPESDEEVGEGD